MLEDQWLGVFPLEKIPFLKEGGFIINTDTMPLPGEHWLAVYIKDDIKVFDPFGYYYPSLLVDKLSLMRKTIIYNRTQYQDRNTFTCGHYCLLWLYECSL